MTDDRLAHLLNNIPPRSIMLLEDIDAAFPDRSNEPQTSAQPSMLTFSGLLNALDGVAASEERIIFMTTNYVSRLDPALIRPGRVDHRVYIGNVTETQAKELYLRFYPNQDDLARLFTDNLKSAGLLEAVSPAQLQGHFVLHRDDAEKAATNIKQLVSPKRGSSY